MRKVVVTEFVTLDGVMDEPQNWSFPYWNDEIAKFKHDELFASDTHLLGRVTYQGLAAAWPSRTDEQGFADRMNDLPKYVVSTTLHKVEWNNSHLIKDAKRVGEEVSRLKQQTGQDILVAGSAIQVNALIEHDLIDEYHLLIYPVVLGKGKRLFRDGSNTTLKLVETKPFSSGVVAHIYQPDRKE
ncbi:MAG TPA: dihydrofolate reductase family protein [Anaerolineales bacterium]|nr:dihydrofolate reductase family protein [Anaerolineales bacterium]